MFKKWCSNKKEWIDYDDNLEDYAICKGKDCKNCEYYKFGCKYPNGFVNNRNPFKMKRLF